ncbi:HET-domain-containing protein [Trematosphaeria pertusa]|uniref:HET-domain-containing protein n=1 Tax=Trematosphaeria pertusa TaxID=390896 RepID=A0A6A6IIH4_9PLEO|nr:HET-domain-containing protein [Trematosphaeria pertusa]KAF2250166.1 HET-domain-containing protein [Trematosphaeria pertusa]
MGISQPPYEYASLKPADAIRILILLPASTYSESLQVRLIHTHGLQTLGQYDDLSPPPYEAISYTWGEPILSHQLECEGQIIEVTASVDNLLRRLRKSTSPRSLWVDSVCINQKDNEEKNIQVQMMGQIYSRAHKVHVWLGETLPHDRIEWLFSFFREMAVAGHDDGKIMEWRALLSNPWQKDAETTVDRFLARPWFRRRWILQEVALAVDMTVRCGRFKIPWQWFARGSRMLHSYLPGRESLRISSARSLETSLATIASLSTPSHQLLDMIFEFDMSECSDPRDRIFALYGMANELKDLPVNYGIHWTGIYSGFAGICIKAGHFLTLLQHVTAFGSLSQGNSGIPSWVPKWNSARFSAKRFSLSDTRHPSQNCELSSEAPNQVHSRDILRHVFQDFRRPDKQGDPEQQSHMSNGTSYGSQTASPTTCKDIAMMFSHCRKSVEVEEGSASQRLLAQILSAAIMDMRLCFDTRDAMLEFVKKFFLIILPDVDAPNLTPEHRRYSELLGIFEDAIDEAIQEAHQASENPTEAELQENFQNQWRIKQVAELLKHHSLFYTRIDTQGGPVYIPGVTSCSIQDGDFVMKPRSRPGEITPAATAFLLRPVGNDPIDRNSADPHLSIVGLCFVAEAESFDEVEDSRGRGPNNFVIV